MPTLSSRRAPWPYDIRIADAATAVGGHIGDLRGTLIGDLRGTRIGSLRPAKRAGLTHGLMLLPQQSTGLLLGKKQTNLDNIYPTSAEYGSAPVYKERTFAFRPTGGMGERMQTSPTDRRYHYGMDVWVTGGLFGKGPLVHPVATPVTTSPYGVWRFAECLVAGALSLVALAGQRVIKVGATDDLAAQVVLHDRGSPRIATDAVRFKGLYSGSVDALYVAWDDGTLEQFDGTTWVVCVLPAGFAANFLEKVGDELWAADANGCFIRKVTADPKVATNWSGPILVGDSSTPITSIRQTGNSLHIFKSDGDVFTVNADGSDNDLFPGLKMAPRGDNGRTAVAWMNALWFRAGRAFFRLEVPGQVITPVGPGRMLANASEVKGSVQAFVGWNTQMGFATIYNESNSTTYLLSYGNWEPVAGDQGTGFTFTDQYDGALAHWTGKQASSMWISGAFAPDTRLYIGFIDGSYSWIKLVPYPLGPNSGAEFTSGSSYIVLPLHHAMFQADRKHWPGFSLFGPSILPGDVVSLSYRLAASSGGPGVTPGGDWLPTLNDFIHNGMRVAAPLGLAAVAIELKLSFESSTPGHTPVCESLAIHERLVPQFRRDFQMTVDARDFIARRDGATVRQNGRQMRDRLMDASAAPASISLLLPDETISDLAIFDYVERQVPHDQRGGQSWAVDIQATQFGLTDVYGIIKRLHGTLIGDLRGYAIGDLRVL